MVVSLYELGGLGSVSATAIPVPHAGFWNFDI